jgi:hypothetical protein
MSAPPFVMLTFPMKFANDANSVKYTQDTFGLPV